MLHIETPYATSLYRSDEFTCISILGGELNNKLDDLLLEKTAKKNAVRRQKSLSQARKSNKF